MNRLLFTSCLLSSLLFSQTLTLERSIQKTLQNHPDVKTFTLRVSQSHSAYDASFSEYLPQVTLSANYNAVQTFVFPANGVFNTIDDSGWIAGASVKQKIWDFSKTSSSVDASKFDESISQLSLEDIKALLVSKVKSLYELMLVEREAVSVREQDLKTKEAYYKQSLAFVEQGLKTSADSSRFLSAVYLSKESLAESQAEFEKAKNSLSLYMGESIDSDVVLDSELLESDFTTSTNIEQKILEKNYQLKIATQNIEKNELLHKSAQASHYGSIDAVGSYNHISSLNEYDSKLLGVTLNIPLYSGGRVSAESQRAKIGAQIAKEQKASAKLALKEESQNLLTDIKKYRYTIEAKKAQLNSSQQTTALLDGRYKEGLATYIEVLDATALELNAKLGLLNAKYQLAQAINRLQYLQGKQK